MARVSSATWGYVTGDVSTFAYRPLYGTSDVVYCADEVNQAAGANAAFVHRPYKVLRVGFRTNAAGAVVDQASAAIGSAVVSQATAPWEYDLQEIKRGETVSTATGKERRGVIEATCKTLAQIKTLIGTEVGDWADPTA